jgi:hypothetical protein
VEPAPAEQPTSADLIKRIKAARVAELRNGINGALQAQLMTDPDLRADVPQLSCEVKRFGTSTVFLYPGEVYERTESGGYRFPKAVALLAARDSLNQHLIPQIVELCPATVREAVVSLLQRGWLGSRGSKSAALFPPGLLLQAYEALRREHPNWSCEAAYETLAEQLGVHSRTIRAHLRKARGGNA